MNKSELSQQLHDIMDSHKRKITMLEEFLLADQFCQAKVFRLPEPEREDETRVSDFIPVTEMSGQDAFRAALYAWGHVYAEVGENTRLVYRLPGAIQLPASDPVLIQRLIESINADRSRFRHLVTSAEELSHPEYRFEFLHAPHMFPMLITLQMYRQIHASFDPGLSSVSFNWANKNVIQNTTREKVLKSLTRAWNYPPKNTTDISAWREQVDREISIIEALSPSASLQHRRPVPVIPQAWLPYSDSKPRMVVASTPILIIGDQRLKIGKLKDYNASRRSKPTETAHQPEPIIPRLWLYEKS